MRPKLLVSADGRLTRPQRLLIVAAFLVVAAAGLVIAAVRDDDACRRPADLPPAAEVDYDPGVCPEGELP